MAELEDFHPTDGHRHDCPTRAPQITATVGGAPMSLPATTCDCARQLYEVARDLALTIELREGDDREGDWWADAEG